MEDERYFHCDAARTTYRVSMHPRERADGRGVDRWLNTVVFEDLGNGRLVGATIYRDWRLSDLTDRDLAVLLKEAR